LNLTNWQLVVRISQNHHQLPLVQLKSGDKIMAIQVYATGWDRPKSGPIADNCIKLFEGNYEISIATEDNRKHDIRIFQRISIGNPENDIDCTKLFFPMEFKRNHFVVFTNSKLVKAIRLAKKLSK
jgi:hypothetical protein